MSSTPPIFSHPPETTDTSSHSDQAVYDTREGHALARKILTPLLPFDAHDYQIEGICAVMDGRDLVATMATGSGKTGYFIMLMLVIRAISQDRNLALGDIIFPKDPAMIVVCPTKALQEDMVRDYLVDLAISIYKGASVTENEEIWAECSRH